MNITTPTAHTVHTEISVSPTKQHTRYTQKYLSHLRNNTHSTHRNICLTYETTHTAHTEISVSPTKEHHAGKTDCTDTYDCSTSFVFIEELLFAS